MGKVTRLFSVPGHVFIKTTLVKVPQGIVMDPDIPDHVIMKTGIDKVADRQRTV